MFFTFPKNGRSFFLTAWDSRGSFGGVSHGSEFFQKLQECWRSWKELVVYYVFPCPCIQSSSDSKRKRGRVGTKSPSPVGLNCWVGIKNVSEKTHFSRIWFPYIVTTDTYYVENKCNEMYQGDSRADLCPGFWKFWWKHVVWWKLFVSSSFGCGVAILPVFSGQWVALNWERSRCLISKD